MAKLDYNTYVQERRLHIDAVREAARSYDKAILTLASGSFAVTVAFLRDIAPEVGSTAVGWLIGSWIMFAVTILVVLLGLLASQWACEARIKELDNLNSGAIDATGGPEPFVVDLVGYLNVAAIVALTMAFGFWMVFVTISLNSENQDEQEAGIWIEWATERDESALVEDGWRDKGLQAVDSDRTAHNLDQ